MTNIIANIVITMFAIITAIPCLDSFLGLYMFSSYYVVVYLMLFAKPVRSF